jgi:hypothetical protein
LPLGNNGATLFTGESINDFSTANNFKFADALATIAGEASQATGVVSFKLAKDTGWGGSCCKVANACKANTKKCDKDGANDKLNLLSTNVDKIISHSAYNPTANTDHDSAVFSVKFTGVMDMPAHLTTLRGRGGLGSSTQKLCDIFWQMTTSATTPTAVQALLHFYVGVKTAITDANMKVSYGFPMNSYQQTAQTGKSTGNDGSIALSTGIKLFVAAGQAPAADYMGFYLLRMIPFFKSTGANEVEVVVNSARAVKCFYWGSNQGAGWIQKQAIPSTSFWTGKTKPAYKYAMTNMLVCKIGVATGTATTGDVIIVPATQQAADATGVNNPFPGYASTDPFNNGLQGAGAAALQGAGNNAVNENPAILGGSDEYLGTMTHYSDADTNLATVVQTGTDLTGTDNGNNAANPTFQALPGGIQGAAYNDNGANTNGANGNKYDIVAITAAEWLVGAAKLAAKIEWQMAAAADWTDP